MAYQDPWASAGIISNGGKIGKQNLQFSPGTNESAETKIELLKVSIF